MTTGQTETLILTLETRPSYLKWCSAAKNACNPVGIPYTWGHVAVQQIKAKQQFSLETFFLNYTGD
jgi:hypothetical protein